MEKASIHAKNLINMLLNVHALTNMHRSSLNNEYRKMAAEWLPQIELSFKDLKRELAEPEKQVTEKENP